MQGKQPAGDEARVGAGARRGADAAVMGGQPGRDVGPAEGGGVRQARLHLLPRARRVAQKRQDGVRHGCRVAGRHQQRRHAVLQQGGDAAHVGTDDRHAAGQCFEHGIGHVVGQAGIEDDVAGVVQGRHGGVVDGAGEAHGVGHAERPGQARQRRALGPAAGQHQARRGKRFAHDGEGAHGAGVVVQAFQVPRHEDARGVCGCCAWRGRPESLQVDHVRHDVGRMAVLLEDAGQIGRRHDDGAGAAQAERHQARRAGQEGCRFAAPVVEQGRLAFQAGDPQRGRGLQMPGPAGIGHDVEQVDRIGRAPQAPQQQGQAQCGAQVADARQPRRQMRTVDGQQLHLCAVLAQLVCQLRRLIRHAAGRRRQRADQRDAQARKDHGAAPAASADTRAYTGA
ncbi:hypothetical protein D3C81_970590 [compost metagenome]